MIPRSRCGPPSTGRLTTCGNRVREATEIRRLRSKLGHSAYYGEALLKALLDLLVGETHYLDNARPSFLVNPLTQQLLEYDRYYPSRRVAIEFHGPQHDRATAVFPDEQAALN